MAEPRSLCAAFRATAERHPDRVALRSAAGDVEVTWRDYRDRAEALAAGLVGLGVRPRDTVGLMLANRIEFHLVDTAVLHTGATPFSVYNTLAEEQIEHVFTNAGNRVVVCEAQFL
ncbi:AMP-binding protein, partial [Jatrophihabitans endophyticus]|uniref:AMP-binding protein n=1 Tax=Jatrophihabitans endophyticus TaxID=1206085 RepID=UPI001A0F3FC6